MPTQGYSAWWQHKNCGGDLIREPGILDKNSLEINASRSIAQIVSRKLAVRMSKRLETLLYRELRFSRIFNREMLSSAISFLVAEIAL